MTDNTVAVATADLSANLPSANNPDAGQTTTIDTLNRPIVQEIQAEPTVQSSDQGLGVHRVEPGDYLGKIAIRYDTDVQTLRNINGIEGSTILVGQEIRYPQ